MFCFHDRLREFKFSDGALIKMCPDCTAFDTKRNEVLRRGSLEVPKSEEKIHWLELLDNAGLPISEGLQRETVLSGDAAGVYKKAEEEYGALFVTDLYDSIKAVMYLHRKPPNKRTTLDDHEWVARQRSFPHTHEMPRRFTSYCAHCTEVVLSVKRPWVVRITKGVYLPIEHECNSVRVYNLQGNLIEVKAQ